MSEKKSNAPDEHTSLDLETANLLRNNAFDIIKKDRDRYQLIYDVVYKYVIQHKLLISDLFTLTNNLDDIRKLDDYHFDIYCSRPLEHSNRLINEIYKSLSNVTDVNTKEQLTSKIETLTLNTVLENEEFTIAFDTRFLVKFYALQHSKRADASTNKLTIIKPKVINSIHYMPVDVEIIDYYHTQYLTGVTTIDENTMYNLWLESNTDIDKYRPEKIGGDQIPDSCYERKKDELEAIKIALYKEFFKGRKDIVQLGPLAVDWLDQGDAICPKYDRIQLVSTMPAEQLRNELNKYLESLGRGYKINLSGKLDLLIPKDFRTKRVVFSISFGSKEKPFLEYFTSCSFELIPAIESNGVLIASRPVLMRFLLIDIWITKFINMLGKLDLDSTQNKLVRYKQLIMQTKSMPFKIEGVLGKYVDYEIEKRRLLLNSKDKRYYPYLPHNYFTKNQELRTLTR